MTRNLVWLALVWAGCSSGGGGPPPGMDLGASDGAGGGGDLATGTQQTATCKRYLDCASMVEPSQYPMLLATYGPSGTCWSSTPDVAMQCETACEAGLDQLSTMSQAPACAPYHFCPNTMVAGTCAESFFQPVAACFPAPTGGCMIQMSQTTQGAVALCWANGDEVRSNPMTGASWTGNGTTCMTDVATIQNGMVVSRTLMAYGLTASYDVNTGDFTCPDGSHVNIGAGGSDCPAVKAILAPPTMGCTAGTCPLPPP